MGARTDRLKYWDWRLGHGCPGVRVWGVGRRHTVVERCRLCAADMLFSRHLTRSRRLRGKAGGEG